MTRACSTKGTPVQRAPTYRVHSRRGTRDRGGRPPRVVVPRHSPRVDGREQGMGATKIGQPCCEGNRRGAVAVTFHVWPRPKKCPQLRWHRRFQCLLQAAKRRRPKFLWHLNPRKFADALSRQPSRPPQAGDFSSSHGFFRLPREVLGRTKRLVSQLVRGQRASGYHAPLAE